MLMASSINNPQLPSTNPNHRWILPPYFPELPTSPAKSSRATPSILLLPQAEYLEQLTANAKQPNPETEPAAGLPPPPVLKTAPHSTTPIRHRFEPLTPKSQPAQSISSSATPKATRIAPRQATPRLISPLAPFTKESL